MKAPSIWVGIVSNTSERARKTHAVLSLSLCCCYNKIRNAQLVVVVDLVLSVAEEPSRAAERHRSQTAMLGAPARAERRTSPRKVVG